MALRQSSSLNPPPPMQASHKQVQRVAIDVEAVEIGAQRLQIDELIVPGNVRRDHEIASTIDRFKAITVVRFPESEVQVKPIRMALIR